MGQEVGDCRTPFFGGGRERRRSEAEATAKHKQWRGMAHCSLPMPVICWYYKFSIWSPKKSARCIVKRHFAWWLHLIWHDFVSIGHNWIKFCHLAQIQTYNKILVKKLSSVVKDVQKTSWEENFLTHIVGFNNIPPQLNIMQLFTKKMVMKTTRATEIN